MCGCSELKMCVCVCVPTNTLQQRAVVDVSVGAVAAVPGDGVHTHAIPTHIGVETLTLVHIWRRGHVCVTLRVLVLERCCYSDSRAMMS